MHALPRGSCPCTAVRRHGAARALTPPPGLSAATRSARGRSVASGGAAVLPPPPPRSATHRSAHDLKALKAVLMVKSGSAIWGPRGARTFSGLGAETAAEGKEPTYQPSGSWASECQLDDPPACGHRRQGQRKMARR